MFMWWQLDKNDEGTIVCRDFFMSIPQGAVFDDWHSLQHVCSLSAQKNDFLQLLSNNMHVLFVCKMCKIKCVK